MNKIISVSWSCPFCGYITSREPIYGCPGCGQGIINDKKQEIYQKINDKTNKKCLHNGCSKCHGSGFYRGEICIHMISCSCPKCSPFSM